MVKISYEGSGSIYDSPDYLQHIDYLELLVMYNSSQKIEVWNY
ncbi:hypothetical protein ACL9SS_09575 [Bacillus subtilis]